MDKNEEEESLVEVRSPISILYEKLARSGIHPSFTFSAYCNPLSETVWQCNVEVPNHGNGCGRGHSKRNAKSKACQDLLDKLGHNITKLCYVDEPSSEELPKVENEQSSTQLPLPCLCDGSVKSESRLYSTGHLNLQLTETTLGYSKQTPETDVDSRFLRLCLDASSSEVRSKYGTAREQNPCGYLEILCRKACCENPTFEYTKEGFAFVTTANLGPWTASGSAPNKKHSKYIATSSLINIIEDIGKSYCMCR